MKILLFGLDSRLLQRQWHSTRCILTECMGRTVVHCVKCIIIANIHTTWTRHACGHNMLDKLFSHQKYGRNIQEASRVGLVLQTCSSILILYWILSVFYRKRCFEAVYFHIRSESNGSTPIPLAHVTIANLVCSVQTAENLKVVLLKESYNACLHLYASALCNW
jgi:hypothetical protein